MMKSLPDLSVILVNWNGERFIGNCLESLSRQNTSRSFEVVLVDNCSSDKSVEIAERFRKKQMALRIIRNDFNAGFAEANNQGVRKAKCRYCLLLNVDTKVSPSFVSDVLAELERNKGVALMGIDTLNRDGLPESRKLGTTSVVLTNVFNLPVKMPFYFAGCCVLVDKVQLGEPFDADYFAYGEDTYLAWKARLMGKKLAFTKRPKVWHFQGGTGSKVPDVVAFHAQKNRLMNFLIFYSAGTLLKLLPLFLLSISSQMLWESVHFRRSALMRMKAALWAAANIGGMLRKRKKLQAMRGIGDESITTAMTCKVKAGHSIRIKIANAASLAYCRLFGIKTVEMTMR